MIRHSLRAGTMALCIACAPELSAKGETYPVPSLLETMELWLATNFDLVPLAHAPRLVALPAPELAEMRYGAQAQVLPGQVIALYDETHDTIYISDGWTGHSPAELSVLVHEIVHRMQAAAELRFACPAERERLAYRAQGAWLAMFGETFASAFDMDPASLLVGTVCTH